MESLVRIGEGAFCDENRFIFDLTREILGLINDAIDIPPVQLKNEVDVVENRLVDLRDELIDRLRAEMGNAPDSLRSVLDHVNMALSLIVSIEYPAGGIHREALEETRDVLKSLLEEP